MFDTLEKTWDQSAGRGWTTVASFIMQALAVSLLLFIPLLSVQGPPRLAWFDPYLVAPPPAQPAPERSGDQRPARGSNPNRSEITAPPSIPEATTPIDNLGPAPAPDVRNFGIPGATGEPGRRNVISDPGDPTPVLPSPAPVASHPIAISHWAEGGLTYRVQPDYPALARQAGIQGAVELRAIISKTGTIERLTVIRGPFMLAPAAVNAVRQWRYRPYVLNGAPIEVETEITVNFTLGRN